MVFFMGSRLGRGFEEAQSSETEGARGGFARRHALLRESPACNAWRRPVRAVATRDRGAPGECAMPWPAPARAAPAHARERRRGRERREAERPAQHDLGAEPEAMAAQV